MGDRNRNRTLCDSTKQFNSGLCSLMHTHFMHPSITVLHFGGYATVPLGYVDPDVLYNVYQRISMIQDIIKVWRQTEEGTNCAERYKVYMSPPTTL